jgi:hypothetical protein
MVYILLHIQIEQQLQRLYIFFTQRVDTTGLLGISISQKIVTAIRMLAVGYSGDDVDNR